MEKRKNFVIEKILRFKPIAFVRKYKYIFLVLGIFLLTYIFGVWKIKKYDIVNIQGKETDQVYVQLETYLKENILDKNYFSFNSETTEKDIHSKIPYVKTIIIEKILPNTVNILYDRYIVEMVGELNGDGCYLLSSDGYMLDEICDEEESSKDCCVTYAHEEEDRYLKAETLSLSDGVGGRRKLLVMESISDLISIFNSLSLNIANMQITEESFDVYTEDGKKYIFDFNGDLTLQLERLYVVMGKIQGDDMEYKTLDLRFERPVLK